MSIVKRDGNKSVNNKRTSSMVGKSSGGELFISTKLELNECEMRLCTIVPSSSMNVSAKQPGVDSEKRYK